MIAAILAALGGLLLVTSIAATRLTGGRGSRRSRRSPRLDLGGTARPIDQDASSHRSAIRLEPSARHRYADETSGAESRVTDRRRPAQRSAGPPHGQVPATSTRAGRQSRQGSVHRGRIVALIASGGAATVAVWLTAGGARGLVLLAGIGGVVVIKQAVARRAAFRLRAQRAAAAPAVIDLLSACLLAGLNPYRSLVRVAERTPGALRTELRRAAAELDMGRTPPAALRAVGDRTNLDELRAVAAALEAAERWGAPPAEALAARAEALRSRARLRAEAEAGRAAVRLAFPLVFCFLPAFVLLVVVPTMAGALRVLTP
jgi:Flp pilus assembly protein TadB